MVEEFVRLDKSADMTNRTARKLYIKKINSARVKDCNRSTAKKKNSTGARNCNCIRKLTPHPRIKKNCLYFRWKCKCSNGGAIPLRPCPKGIPKNLKCLIMVRYSKCFVLKSAQLSFPRNRVILRRCNHSVGVAIGLIRQAPRRIAMARLAVASSLISMLRLSTPSPNPFALTSTPCCCKITSRSHIIETQPIPAAAALTAA